MTPPLPAVAGGGRPLPAHTGEWAAANNIELAYTPTYSSWLNRIEALFQALRYFALDGTDHPSHREQVKRANVA